MESSLKQRIYENILGIIENWRYIKSTAEATIPNFILLYISFMIVAFLIAQGAAYSLFTPHLHGIHQDKKIITHEITIFNGKPKSRTQQTGAAFVIRCHP